MSIIERKHGGNTVVVANSSAATTSGSLPFSRWAGGVITIANTNSATQINWHASPDYDVTPLQVYADGSALTTAVTVGVHPIPDALFGVAYVCPVITGATTMAMTVSVKG